MQELHLPESIRDIDTFFNKLKELSGQNVKLCMQCGTCSASCPMMDHMGMSPRQIMHFLQFGLEEHIEAYNTYWICASCHTCSVRCPRGIDIARVMEALRQLILRKNQNFIEPSELAADVIMDCPPIAMVAGFRKLTS
jgi:heterodisulfide reductase subunit C